MQIFINTPNAGTTTLNVQPSDSISDVMLQIQDQNGIPLEQLFLLHQNKIIVDTNKTIENYQIQKESTLYVFPRLLGGRGKGGRGLTPQNKTIPNSPTNFTSISGNNQVTLNWDAPAFNGRSSITGYKIETKIGDDGSYSVLEETTLTNPYIATGLANGTIYSFKISALNCVGASPADSNPETTSTPFDSFDMTLAEWHYQNLEGGTDGPCNLKELNDLFTKGDIDLTTSVFCEQIVSWSQIGFVDGLVAAIMSQII